MDKRRIRGSEGGAGTLASAVYDQLRRDIMTGILKPEEKLRIETLKERYLAGSTPIREALNRLTAEGLVMQHDQRGFQVPPVSLEDLNDLTRARAMLYDVTLREAIAQGDMAWEEKIVLAFHRLSRTPAYDQAGVLNPEWGELHREFHRALIAACNSRWLIEYTDTLFDLADRYRFLSMRSGNRTTEEVKEEHRGIMDAVLNRETERAIRLIKAHIRHTPDAARQTSDAAKVPASRMPETTSAADAAGDEAAHPEFR